VSSDGRFQERAADTVHGLDGRWTWDKHLEAQMIPIGLTMTQQARCSQQSVCMLPLVTCAFFISRAS